MKKAIAITTFLFLYNITGTVNAGRNISLPFEQNFDTMDYSDLIWISGGATHTHLPSGGWQGGAAKFTPPTSSSSQYYSGLGSFNGINEKKLHIRVLAKVGSTYHVNQRSVGYGYQNKFIIVTRGGADRGMTIFERCGSSGYYTFGACDDNTCLYECGGSPDWWPNGSDAFKSTDYLDEWFCLELECDLTTRTSKIYLWTQDGVLDGEYMSTALASGSGAYDAIQIIGGFYNGYHLSDENTYVMFDELKIDTQFIGPPAGFVGGGPINSSVTVTAIDSSAIEEGQETGTYRISCSPNYSGQPVGFVMGGTAAEGQDCNLSHTSPVSITGSYLDITLTPVDDSEQEGTETATLTLQPGSGYDVGAQGYASITIADNDSPLPPLPPSDTGLPWTSDFEENNFHEWNGGTRGELSIVTSDPYSGSYCARAQLTSGTHSDNYADFYFGDFYTIGKDKVEEVYLSLYSKFDPGYVWPSDTQKIALLNLTDGQVSQRRYQVMIVVDREGRYFVEYSYIASWQFFGLAQNQGTPAAVRFGEWDKLKLYTKLNTPGNSDGVVKLWVNNELKISYDDVNIRQNTLYGMNKLILSSYATDASGFNGVQYYDDWILSETDPAVSDSPSVPTGLTIGNPD